LPGDIGNVALTATSMAMLVAALSKTSKQADGLGTVLGFLLVRIGSAIPIHPTTQFTRAGGLMGVLSRPVLQGHAVEGYFKLMAEDAGLAGILPELGTLLGMPLVFFAIVSWRFKFEQ
jgi:hypothetical protein